MNNKSIYIVSAAEYFKETVAEAINKRKVQTFPQAQEYLINILKNYIQTGNLFDSKTEDGRNTRKTLAEMFLEAQGLDKNSKKEVLKKLGEVSLYVSGFFSDSFNRKIIDVDYYIDMGEVAYSTLAEETKEDLSRKVYLEFSKKFLEFVDVLSYISQHSLIQHEENVLRIYEKYLKTGSPLAREILEEKGIVTVPFDKSKKNSAQ